MPRIPAVKTADAGFLVKLFYKFAGKRFGAVPEPMAVSAHHPALFRASGLHEMMVEKASKVLPSNVRELAVYRVATQLGCAWCIDFGTMLQLHEGLDIERLKKIDDYAKSPAFTDQERLAVIASAYASASPVTVTDEQVAELEREFGRKGVIELTYQIGIENLRARMNSALDITAQGFTSGDACQVPLP